MKRDPSALSSYARAIVAVALVLAPLLAASPSGAVTIHTWDIQSQFIDQSGPLDTIMPAVAIDDDGNVFVAWQQEPNNETGNVYEVWTRRFSPGTGWDAPMNMSLGGPTMTWYPSLAVAPTGGAALVSEGVGGVFAREFEPGTGWSNASWIGDGASWGPPQVSLDGRGAVMTVWTANVPASFDGIFSNRYVPGVGWGARERIDAPSNASASSRYPQLATDPGGNATAVWNAGAIWANRYAPGVGWGTPFRIQAPGNQAGWPDVAADAGGNAIVCWPARGSTSPNHTIFVSRLTSAAGWSTPAEIETNQTGESNRCRLSSDPAGNVFVLWEKADDYLWGSHFAPQGGWEAPVPLNDVWLDYRSDPAIAVASTGVALAAYAEADWTNSVFSIAARVYTPGQGWGPEVKVNESSVSHLYRPVAALNAAGQGAIAWEDLDTTADGYDIGVALVQLTNLSLVVTSPANGTMVGTAAVRVTGSVTPGAAVTVNGVVASVDLGGGFDAVVPLLPGSNLIRAHASGANGTSVEASLMVVFADPIPALEANLSAALEQLASIQGQLAEALANLSTAQADIASLRQSANSSAEMFADASRRLNESLDDLAALRGDLNGLTLQLESANGTINALLSQFDLLNGTLADTRGEVAALRTETAAIRAALQAQNQTIDGLQRELARTRESLDATTKRLASAEVELRAARGDLGTLQALIVAGLALILMTMLAGFAILRRRLGHDSDEEEDEQAQAGRYR